MGVEVKSMEVKKPQQTSSSENFSAVRSFSDFIADVKSEIKKITWTSREELQTYTKIVILATFLFGMAIYGLDLVIQGTLSVLTLLLNLMG